MTLRAWLERGVIIVAALATIATSRKGWSIEATKLPDDPTRARIYVVEASHQPHVEYQLGAEHEYLQPLDPAATWPGTARYLIPKNATVYRVLIREHCNSGTCEAPSHAKIRIASITPVETWKLEATQVPPVQPTNMNPDVRTTFRVVVTASHRVRLTVTSTGPEGRVSRDGDAHTIDFGTVQTPTSFTWSVIATSEDTCPEPTKPCQPPAAARLSIDSIARESHAP